MLKYILLGGGFAFAAVVQPGPLQAFLLSRAMAEGWRRTLPAALSPLLSDGPIAVLVLIVLGRVPTGGQVLLRAAGGVLLLYLAWSALRQTGASSGGPVSAPDSARLTLFQAAMVNLLNPSPYLGWALVLGPAAIAGWHEGPAHAAALVLAFYGVMTAGLAGFILLASTARLLRPRAQRTLVIVSAAVLAGLGVYQLIASAQGFVALGA